MFLFSRRWTNGVSWFPAPAHSHRRRFSCHRDRFDWNSSSTARFMMWWFLGMSQLPLLSLAIFSIYHSMKIKFFSSFTLAHGLYSLAHPSRALFLLAWRASPTETESLEKAFSAFTVGVREQLSEKTTIGSGLYHPFIIFSRCFRPNRFSSEHPSILSPGRQWMELFLSSRSAALYSSLSFIFFCSLVELKFSESQVFFFLFLLCLFYEEPKSFQLSKLSECSRPL